MFLRQCSVTSNQPKRQEKCSLVRHGGLMTNVTEWLNKWLICKFGNWNKFVGMLTDSRSFHTHVTNIRRASWQHACEGLKIMNFRMILIQFGKIVEDICFNNAKDILMLKCNFNGACRQNADSSKNHILRCNFEYF